MVHHTHWEPARQLSWPHQRVKLFSSTTAGRTHKSSYLRAVTSPTVHKLKTTTNKQTNKQNIYRKKNNLQADKSAVESNKMVGETKFRLCPAVETKPRPRCTPDQFSFNQSGAFTCQCTNVFLHSCLKNKQKKESTFYPNSQYGLIETQTHGKDRGGSAELLLATGCQYWIVQRLPPSGNASW